MRQISTSTGAVSSAATMRSVRRSGKIESRKLMVSESTIRMSKKLITIQRMVNLNCDSTIRIATRPSESAADSPGRRNATRKKQLRNVQHSRAMDDPNQPYSVHTRTASATRWMAAIAPARTFHDSTRRPIAAIGLAPRKEYSRDMVRAA